MPTYRVPVRFRYTIEGRTVVEVDAKNIEEAHQFAVDNFDVSNIDDPSDANEEIEAEVIEDEPDDAEQ